VPGGADRHGSGVLGHPGELDADRIVGHLAHHAGALERLRHPVRECLRARGANEAGAVLDHLERVCGTAHAGHPFRAEDGFEQCRGRGPVGRHKPLGEGNDAGAVRYAEPLELRHRRANFLGGNS
jgi:hypothetical protein